MARPWLSAALAAALLTSACGEEAPSAGERVAPADAAPAPFADPPADARASYDAAPRFDDDGGDYADDEFHMDEPSLRGGSSGRSASESESRLHLTLRSTPPGARVLVDGEPVGRTPAYWEGKAKGRAREIAFVLPGYEMARYRFVPTQSGIVHATLDRLPGPLPPDAGPAGGTAPSKRGEEARTR